MNVIHSNEPFEPHGENSIFLAGPTPRSAEVKSWRPRAVEILQDLNYKGVVYVPEWADYSPRVNYDDQVRWEYQGLESAKVIAFWVPRDLHAMPAFTTNVEFGRYAHERRALYGRPDGAPKTRYLDWLYGQMNNRWGYRRGEPHSTLEGLLAHCAEAASKATDRELADWVFG